MLKRLLARLKRDERGLTLVELLAVIVILAIVGGIATVSIGGVIDNAKKDAHIANGLQLIAAAKLYEAGGEKIDATNGIKSADLKAKGMIGDLINPWTKKADATNYTGTVKKSGDDYTVTLSAVSEGCIAITDKKESDLMVEGRKLCTATTP